MDTYEILYKQLGNTQPHQIFDIASVWRLQIQIRAERFRKTFCREGLQPAAAAEASLGSSNWAGYQQRLREIPSVSKLLAPKAAVR